MGRAFSHSVFVSATFDDRDEDLLIVLPEVSVRTVRNFIQMFYTGLAAFNGQQELIEFQDFLHGQLKFYGRYTVNDVYQEYPDQICESQTISGQDLDAVKHSLS